MLSHRIRCMYFGGSWQFRPKCSLWGRLNWEVRQLLSPSIDSCNLQHYCIFSCNIRNMSLPTMFITITYKKLWKPARYCLLKQVLYFWGIKMAHLCLQVRKPKGSYTRLLATNGTVAYYSITVHIESLLNIYSLKSINTVISEIHWTYGGLEMNKINSIARYSSFSYSQFLYRVILLISLSINPFTAKDVYIRPIGSCTLYHLWRHQFKCHRIFLITR